MEIVKDGLNEEKCCNNVRLLQPAESWYKRQNYKCLREHNMGINEWVRYLKKTQRESKNVQYMDIVTKTIREKTNLSFLESNEVKLEKERSLSRVGSYLAEIGHMTCFQVKGHIWPKSAI